MRAHLRVSEKVMNIVQWRLPSGKCAVLETSTWRKLSTWNLAEPAHVHHLDWAARFVTGFFWCAKDCDTPFRLIELYQSNSTMSCLHSGQVCSLYIRCDLSSEVDVYSACVGVLEQAIYVTEYWCGHKLFYASRKRKMVVRDDSRTTIDAADANQCNSLYIQKACA